MNGTEDAWEEIDIEEDGPPVDEVEFKDWYQRWADTTGLDPNPDDPRHKYDYRAAFQAGVEPQYNDSDGKYHWDSRYKSDDHPNRFVGGIDTKTGKPEPAMPKAAAKEKPAEDKWDPIDLATDEGAPETEAEAVANAPAPGGMKKLKEVGQLKKKPARTPEEEAAAEAAAAQRAADKRAQQERANEEASGYMKIVAHGAIPESWLESDTVKDMISGAAMDRAGMLWDKRRYLMAEDKDLTPEELKYLDVLDKVMGYDSTDEGFFSRMPPAAGEIVGQQINQLMDDQMNPYLTGGYAALAAGATAAYLSGPLALVTIPAAMVSAGGMAMRAQYYRRAKAVEGGLAFKELMEEDTEGEWDTKTKAVAASIISTINASLEMVGFEASLKLIPGLREVTKGGIRPFVKSSKVLRDAILREAKQYLVGVAGETGTEVLQELPTIITKAIMQNESVIEALGSEDTADQLKGIIKKVGSGMALLGIGGPAINVGKQVKSLKDAKKFTEIVLPMYEKTADAMEGGLQTGAITVDEVQNTLDKARDQWPDNPIIPRMEEMIRSAGGEVKEVGPSMYTEATPEDIATLKSYLGVHLKDSLGEGEEVVVEPAVGRTGMGVVQQVAQTLGSKAVFYKGDGPANSFNGIYDESSNTIFINENSADPFATVLGHETLHQMRRDAPDLYSRLSDVIQGNEIGFDAWLDNLNELRVASGMKELSKEDALAREEFIADFTGSQFRDAAFWSKVERANPTLGQKLARYVYDAVEKIKAALGLRKDYVDPEYVKNLDEIQNALASVYVEFAGRKVTDQTALPVEKTVGQKVVDVVGAALSPAAAEAKTVGAKVATGARPSQVVPVAAEEKAQWEPIDLGEPAAEKPKKKTTPQQEFDHLWGNLPPAEKKRLADLPTDDEMSAAEKVGLLKAEIASQAKKAKKSKKVAAPEPSGEEISGAPVGEAGAAGGLKASIRDDSDRLKAEILEYRRKNGGRVVIPDEIMDAWDYIKTQVSQGSVERGGREPGLNHIVGTTYPKWFGMNGGQWSRKEFDAIARNIDIGKKLTFNQYWRFRELVDVMLDVQDNDREMARMRDAKDTIAKLEDEGWGVVMDLRAGVDILEGQEVQIDGNRYTQDGWTSDGFILLKGKEDLKLEPFDQVFVEGERGGKSAEVGDLLASLKLRDVEIEVAAVDAEGNAARVKSMASSAVEENNKQTDFAKRLLECLNS